MGHKIPPNVPNRKLPTVAKVEVAPAAKPITYPSCSRTRNGRTLYANTCQHGNHIVTPEEYTCLPIYQSVGSIRSQLGAQGEPFVKCSK